MKSFYRACTLAVVVAIPALTGTAHAAQSENISVTVTIQNLSISLSTNTWAIGTIIAASTTQMTEADDITVTNDGNTAITVQVSTTGSGFTASWNATSATLNSNGDKAGFELTLTVNGAGSCTVSIDLV